MPFTLKLALSLIVAVAAAYDCKYRKIPNWFNLSALVVGFGLNVFYGGASGLVPACEGFALALAIYFPLYLLKGMGRGSVHLLGIF